MNLRYHGLDYTRSVLMIIGIFFHASLIYKYQPDWRIFNDSGNILFNYFTDFIKSFRMEAFYIICGFFYVLVFDRGISKNILRDRLSRVMIPLIFTGGIINSVMNYYSFNEHYSGVYNYILKGEWMGHLWFIGNLAIYYLSFYFLLTLCCKSNNAINNKSKIYLFSFLIAPLSSIFLSGLVWIIKPENFLFISTRALFDYAPYFILGMYLYKERDAFFELMNINLIMVKIIFAGALFYSLSLLLSSTNYFLTKVFFTFSGAFFGIASISLLSYIGRNPSEKIKRFSDASYTIYLLHQPVIVIFYSLIMFKYNLPILIEFLIICIFTLLSTFYFHHLIVKKSNILSFLFSGKLKNRK